MYPKMDEGKNFFEYHGTEVSFSIEILVNNCGIRKDSLSSL